MPSANPDSVPSAPPRPWWRRCLMRLVRVPAWLLVLLAALAAGVALLLLGGVVMAILFGDNNDVVSVAVGAFFYMGVSCLSGLAAFVLFCAERCLRGRE